MADNARNNNDSERPKSPEHARAEEAALSARLRGLGNQLDQHRPHEAADAARSRPTANASGYARGFRLSSELVAGVAVGAAIGWALDYLLGIRPWGMIVFLLLGFAAGVVNVVREAGVAPGSDPGDSPGSNKNDTT
jgi:ATP synthase protein I